MRCSSSAGVARKIRSDTPSQFIDALATRPARFEEKFNHVAIEGDEDIVTVHFDYGFYVDDTLTNSGRELWQERPSVVSSQRPTPLCVLTI